MLKLEEVQLKVIRHIELVDDNTNRGAKDVDMSASILLQTSHE